MLIWVRRVSPVLWGVIPSRPGQLDPRGSRKVWRRYGELTQPTLRYLDPLRERGTHKISSDARAVLLTVNQKVAAKPSLNDVVDFLFEGTRSIIPFDRIGLAFVEDDGHRIVSHYARADYQPLLLTRGYAGDLRGSSLEPMIKTGKSRIIDDLVSLPRSAPRKSFDATPGRRRRTVEHDLPPDRGRPDPGVPLSQLPPAEHLHFASCRAGDGDLRAAQPGGREGVADRAADGRQPCVPRDAGVRQPRDQRTPSPRSSPTRACSPTGTLEHSRSPRKTSWRG